MPVEADALRQVMAHYASGVTVVTALHSEGFHGMTATAFCSVSLEPPLVLVCIDNLSVTQSYVAEAGSFGISILSRGQAFLADRFAGRAPLVDPQFDGVPYHREATGVPLLDGALAWLDCRVVSAFDAGDHTIFVGQVEAAGSSTVGEPLVFFRSAFPRLGTG